MRHEAIVLGVAGQSDRIALEWEQCVAIGYAGRDQKSVEAHVAELRKLGVPAPTEVPSMYWIDPTRISSNDELFVIGDGSSGEIEVFAAYDACEKLYITVASDHTDRKLETVSVSKAKQGCSKIIGNLFWSLEEIRDHWDDLILRSWVREDAGAPERLYQEGTLAMLLLPEELADRAQKDAIPGRKLSFFSGTIPLAGEVSYRGAFRMELEDPVLKRAIKHEYTVTLLPDRN